MPTTTLEGTGKLRFWGQPKKVPPPHSHLDSDDVPESDMDNIVSGATYLSPAPHTNTQNDEHTRLWLEFINLTL